MYCLCPVALVLTDDSGGDSGGECSCWLLVQFRVLLDFLLLTQVNCIHRSVDHSECPFHKRFYYDPRSPLGVRVHTSSSSLCSPCLSISTLHWHIILAPSPRVRGIMDKRRARTLCTCLFAVGSSRAYAFSPSAMHVSRVACQHAACCLWWGSLSYACMI